MLASVYLHGEIDKDTLMLPLHVPDFSRIHVFETFSGGYAGWKHATRFLSDVFGRPMQTIGIDSSLEACIVSITA